MSSSSDRTEPSTGHDASDTLAASLSRLTLAGPSQAQIDAQRKAQEAARADARTRVAQTLGAVTDASTGQSFGTGSASAVPSSSGAESGSHTTAASTTRQDEPPAATRATAIGNMPPSPASKRSWDGHIRNFAAPKPFNPDWLRDTVQDDTRTDEAGPSDTA